MATLNVTRVADGVVRVQGSGFRASKRVVIEPGNNEVTYYDLVELRVIVPATGRVFGERAEADDYGAFSKDIAVDHAMHNRENYTVRAFEYGAAGSGAASDSMIAEWSGALLTDADRADIEAETANKS